MPIRDVKNETTLNLTRDVRAENIEQVTATIVAAENHSRIIGADVAIPNDIVYAGYDHIASGVAQYNANDA